MNPQLPVATTVAVSSSANPSLLGQPVTFTVTVTPTSGAFDNGGMVQFAVDGTTYGAPVALSSGVATIIDAALGVGTHTITAAYSGDAAFSGSSNLLTGGQAVCQSLATTTVVTTSLNPSPFGQSVTFTAAVTSASGQFDNGGSVQFAVDGATYGSSAPLNSAGRATITASNLTAGTHTITAAYNGDANFTGSSGAFVEMIGSGITTTTISDSSNPSVSGQAVTFTASVSLVGLGCR